MLTSLADRVCVVTGGAQGLGWAIAQAFAVQGAIVYVCDISDANLARAEAARAQLPFGSSIHLMNCDVTDRAALERWLSKIHADASRIDVLVNNAAFVLWETVAAMSVEDAQHTMRVGYDAMVYATKAVLPMMQVAGTGHIVNIGSSTGRIYTGKVSAAYAAVKAAIDAYSHILQLELKGTGIGVTLVRPATIGGTEFFQKHVQSTQMPRVADFLRPLTPPEVADAIIQAVRRNRKLLDLPSYMSLFYLVFDLAPSLIHLLTGGSARKNFGAIQWQYTDKPKRITMRG